MDMFLSYSFIQLVDELIKYPGEHCWEFVFYGLSATMVFYWDDRPVYIFYDAIQSSGEKSCQT